MDRFKRGFVVFGATLALLGAGFGPGRVARADGDGDHPFVRIRANRLQPEVVHIATGDPLGWINSTSQIARVAFDRSTARHMICDRNRGFRLTGDKLESPQIQALQFASMCTLTPGEYRYRVELTAGVGAGGSGGALRQLEGRIVVE